jgi:hypothetical protein
MRSCSVCAAAILAATGARGEEGAADLPGHLRFEASTSSAGDPPSTHPVHSYSGVARMDLQPVGFALQLFGNLGDPLAQDPERHEDFLAPEFAWFISPVCTARAQFAKALRAGSDDQLAVTVAWQF